LALVADTFAAASTALIASAVPRGVTAAVDLGCGPGHTTRLLAEVSGAERTIGLDRSPAFVARARASTTRPDIAYAVHDATVLPFPTAPADAIHARLLLAHLPDPLAVAERWRSQLRAGGVLVLDEVETIHAPPGVLSDYLTVANALVASEGASMYAGPALAPLGGKLVELDVPAPRAAAMFAMNLSQWRADALARNLMATPELDRLASELDGITRRPRSLTDRRRPGVGNRSGNEVGEPVRWVLRQVVCGACARSSMK
jgi:SAM-dependent methyltransferase